MFFTYFWCQCFTTYYILHSQYREEAHILILLDGNSVYSGRERLIVKKRPDDNLNVKNVKVEMSKKNASKIRGYKTKRKHKVKVTINSNPTFYV